MPNRSGARSRSFLHQGDCSLDVSELGLARQMLVFWSRQGRSLLSTHRVARGSCPPPAPTEREISRSSAAWLLRPDSSDYRGGSTIFGDQSNAGGPIG
jgi:hypothetical protein